MEQVVNLAPQKNGVTIVVPVASQTVIIVSANLIS